MIAVLVFGTSSATAMKHKRKGTNHGICKTAVLDIIQCSRFVYIFLHERIVLYIIVAKYLHSMD